MGRPKALVEGWLVRAVASLEDCDHVVVVLGAAADQARTLLEAHDVTIVVAADWDEGMGASLRAGLRHLQHGEATRCLVALVDLPDVTAEVVRRLLDRPDDPDVLARATYDGRPGHPVLLGRTHWGGVIDTAVGDRGARAYLEAHAVVAVECGDLASGRDVDTAPSDGATRDQPAAE
jgi:CTP:molybdopterin cytidylyltransferase MocA